MRHLLLVLLLAACGDKDGDTADIVYPDSGTEDDGGKSGCDETSIKVLGDEPPTVGDEWTVYLYCDDAMMTGPSVIRVDPPELAELVDNVISWTTAGEGTLKVQVGSTHQTMDVTVGEAE